MAASGRLIGAVLIVIGGVIGVGVAIWLGPGAVLVRVDILPDMQPAKEAVEAALTAEGMTRVDEETLLAAPVALQLLALRQSSWDLWGSDIETAFFTLRAMAGADDLRPIMEQQQRPGDDFSL